MTGRKRYDTEFGASVSTALAEAKTTQNQLATDIGASPSYLNQMMTGRKVPTPKWVNLVADTLRLQEDRRKMLHSAAAKDAGYDILDLTKP